MFKVTTFLFILFIFIDIVKCAEILAIFHFPLKSLHLSGVALAEILADKNHNVTLVSSVEIMPPPESFTHVFLRDVANGNVQNYFNMNRNSYYQAYMLEYDCIEITKATMQSAHFKQVLASKKFDLVIVEAIYSDALFYIAEYLKAPLLIYLSLDATHFTNSLNGNYAAPSYIPNILTGYTSNMTFIQRINNLMISVTAHAMRYIIGIPSHDKTVKDNFPEAPSITDYYNKASVILMNGDASLKQPVPTAPGTIDIGGFHIKSPKPLPIELEAILNNSKHGVIYFSMGSILQSSLMPNKTIMNLLEAFSKFNQTVLWKWEADDLPGKPPNVVIKKWLPQNDILAHKNVKLFITHGGMHSLLETIYHGVPCVALPVFFDQKNNAKRAQECGFAQCINYEELTSERLEWAVGEVLNNPRYVESVKKRSSIMRDRPLSQADTLSFWVDYVIRHNGAHHLKLSSLKLAWYQYFLLDVVLFIIFCLMLFIVAMKYLLKNMLCKYNTLK